MFQPLLPTIGSDMHIFVRVRGPAAGSPSLNAYSTWRDSSSLGEM